MTWSFRSVKLHQKSTWKLVEITWNFVKIWSSMYWHNIGAESTWIWRAVPVGKWISMKKSFSMHPLINRFLWSLTFNFMIRQFKHTKFESYFEMKTVIRTGIKCKHRGNNILGEINSLISNFPWTNHGMEKSAWYSWIRLKNNKKINKNFNLKSSNEKPRWW